MSAKIPEAVRETALSYYLAEKRLKRIHQGKVRDTYEVPGQSELLFIVASDRLSIFDFVLPCLVPMKGEVLTALTVFWLRSQLDIRFNHHLVACGDEMNTLLPSKLRSNPELMKRGLIVKWAVMTWSSGINGRIIKDGKIVDDNAELGHIISSLQYPPIDCKCGGKNHLECLISGDTIKTMVLNKIVELSIPRPSDIHPNDFLDQEYIQGALWAKGIYNYITMVMAAFIATLKSFHPDLDLIVFKGGVAKARLEMMKPLIYENLEMLAMPALNAGNIRLELSTLPTDLDGLVGAAKALERMIKDGEL